MEQILAIGGKIYMTQSTPDDANPSQAPYLARRTLRDYVIFLPSLMVPGLVNVGLVPLLTRLFEPEGYGHYVLAIVLWNLLPVAFTHWIEGSIMRFAFRYQGRRLAFLKVVALLEVIISAGVVLGGLFILSRWPPHSDELYDFYQIVLLGFPAYAVFIACQNYFRAVGLSVTYSVMRVLRVLGGLGIGLLLTYRFNWGLRAFLVGIVANVIVLALFAVFLAIRDASANDYQVSRTTGPVNEPVRLSSLLKHFIPYGFPLAGVLLAGSILSLGDRYILNHYLDSIAVGVYSAGYVIPEAALRLVAESLVGAVIPIVFEIWEAKGEQAVQSYLRRLIWIFTYLAVPLWILMFTFRHQIRLLINPAEAYAPVADIIPVVALALLLHGYAIVLDLLFLARTETLLPFLVIAVGAVVNIGLNLVLVPRMGMWGAAAVTLTSYGGMLILTSTLVHRRLSVPFHLQLSKLASLSVAVIGLVIMSLLTLKLTDSLPVFPQLLLSSASGSVLYSALLFWLDEDWRQIVTNMLNYARDTVRASA